MTWRYLEDVLLKYLDSTTFLGITIDKNLNRNKQIEMLSSKLLSIIYLLKLVSKIVIKRLTIQFYCKQLILLFFVLSVTAKFCNLYYFGVHYHFIIYRKFSFYRKKTLRVIEKKKKNETCKELFLQSRILTVPFIYILEYISYVVIKNLIENVSYHHHNYTRQTFFNPT